MEFRVLCSIISWFLRFAGTAFFDVLQLEHVCFSTDVANTPMRAFFEGLGIPLRTIGASYSPTAYIYQFSRAEWPAVCRCDLRPLLFASCF